MVSISAAGLRWPLFALLLMSLAVVSYGQSCNSLTEIYTLSGQIDFGNYSSGASCYRIIPQPSSTSHEVRVIDVSLDPTYIIGLDADITIYSTWFPSDQDRYVVKTWADCCDSEVDVSVKSPIITIVFNTTQYQDSSFYIRFAAQPTTRTKFSTAFFQGLMVAIGLPILSLLISWCTFRRGMCDKAGKGRRLSRKTPLAERIMTGIAGGIGVLFFFLLTFRVFG